MPHRMTTIAAFVRLVPEDRRLVLRCCRLLISAMLGVRLRPLKRLIRAIDERVARTGVRDESPEDALRVCDVCDRSHRAGVDFEAHAWLERDGVVVLGAPTDAYRPIWQWPADPVGKLESIGI